MKKWINELLRLHIPKQKCFCLFHEDNQSYIKRATGTKFYPKTKHITLKYHNFRTIVKPGWVEVQYRLTNLQFADILTKPLTNEAFFTLCYMICGWGYAPNKSIYNYFQRLLQKYGCFVTRECSYIGLIVPVLYIRDSQLDLLDYDYVSYTSTSRKLIISVGTGNYICL